MEILKTVAEILGYISAIAAAVAVIVKVFQSLKVLKEGLKCLLRSRILTLYYEHKDAKSITQYQREDVDYLFAAYRSLKGNSFVVDIYEKEMRDWEVTR